ncbi:gamma-glutamyltransferase family protein [Cellulomonas sp. PhB150]|uniref:gamma-glutamyltransferase family protein n=1 Tax=Cellulomonas sp. PhB150 TaxID=2485188 RepID=UPI000F4A78FE|nr:gamma-glutamyltransferase [Cellulomonas sp. PhB150]ROS23967.1 gamma-glutamyltranspeptidase/glutathione hydrolase [Cellulomonas sp. PhB150]
MFTTRPELSGTFGMVASTHWLASAIGMRILEAGGNAFDAAAAAGFTLSVVEPHLNGPGGDAPIIGHRAADGHTFVVCGQGTAPAAATIEAYRDLGLDLVPGTGHLAAVVPGAFGAWLDLLARYGTLPLAAVLAPAIGYARNGYPLVPAATRTIGTVADHFAEHWPSSAEVYLPHGQMPEAGTLFTNPALADTFDRLLGEARAASPDREAQIEAARRAFYQGFVAEAIDAFVATPVRDSSGRDHAGLLRADDLAGWRASEESTASIRFAGRTVHKTRAWGQGPVLLQQLAMLEALGVEDVEDVDGVHAVLEVAKLAFADREAWYGDDTDVPLDTLLSSAYAAERARLVGANAADGLVPGSPDGRIPRLALVERIGDGVVGTGEPTVSSAGLSPGDTCHVDVVDRWGNRVSATPSGGWLQSSPVVPGLGFALPTRAQMFWLEPGLPNSLAPGKRPRTTLSPGMVLDDDGSGFAFGTPGGDQQDQWTVPFLLRHLVGGLDLQAAIDAPMWHSEHVPSSFYPRGHVPLGVAAESRLGADVLDGLAARGHAVDVVGPWTLGRLSAAGIRADGMLVAAANPRGMQGYAVGR